MVSHRPLQCQRLNGLLVGGGTTEDDLRTPTLAISDGEAAAVTFSLQNNQWLSKLQLQLLLLMLLPGISWSSRSS